MAEDTIPEFMKRHDGKYEAEDVLGASVALGLSGDSPIIVLALEVSDSDTKTRTIQLALSPEVGGPLALQLETAASELGFVPLGQVVRTDLRNEK